MAVGLNTVSHLYPIKGFKLGIASAGIKKAGRKDLVVMQFPVESTVAGIFTRNAFRAAPVLICQERLATTQAINYLVVNTGNANAGTGQQGMSAAYKVCDTLAKLVNIPSGSVLPFSTGVIGEPLPVDKISNALPAALAGLKEDNWLAAANGIMTTDTMAKAATRQFSYQGVTVSVTGISKGAGMICPNMGTMLGYIATDAKVSASILQSLLQDAANKSFNRITIDGDTSTNDSCILVATGQNQLPEITDMQSEYFALLKEAVFSLAMELAQAIVRDGEGATKFVTVNVNGGATHQECLDIAYAIAHSPLIKTALFASDPNWGRILAAVGYAGIKELDVSLIDIYLDQLQIVHAGCRAENYTEEQGANVMAQNEITIQVVLNRGNCQETIWTTDLSHEYVKINAEYRT